MVIMFFIFNEVFYGNECVYNVLWLVGVIVGCDD